MIARPRRLSGHGIRSTGNSREPSPQRFGMDRSFASKIRYDGIFTFVSLFRLNDLRHIYLNICETKYIGEEVYTCLRRTGLNPDQLWHKRCCSSRARRNQRWRTRLPSKILTIIQEHQEERAITAMTVKPAAYALNEVWTALGDQTM